MKNNRCISLLMGVILLMSSCENDDGIFTRENDQLVCDCTEQVIEQNVLCEGTWTVAYGDVDWIVVTPDHGTGNGKEYGFFQLHIAYNNGDERVGTIQLVHSGISYPVTVTQGSCAFAYGTPIANGNLFQNTSSTAVINLPYQYASGEESVEISGMLSGVAADGLSVATANYHSFNSGSGELSIPIEGAPTRDGIVLIELFADGVSVGTCKFNVISDPNALPEGFPVGWNFYALGMTGTGPTGSQYDYSWTQSATNPTTTVNPLDAHRILPTSGLNTNAYLTASGTVADNSKYNFNPSIQINGLMENDYWLFVIPVKNIRAEHKLAVEASLGGAGSGPGYYALEYSADGLQWKLAEGSELMEVFGLSAQVHFRVPSENASTDRKTYNKTTDKGYHRYVFPLTGIDPIYEGNLYLRLRICMNRRINSTESTNAIATAWADLKGFEVEMVDE